MQNELNTRSHSVNYHETMFTILTHAISVCDDVFHLRLSLSQFHYAILVADRSEAGRRPARSC